MTTYSDAAKTYADKHCADHTAPGGWGEPYFDCHTAAAFDAGAASLASPARLSGPDDPRIKPGARFDQVSEFLMSEDGHYVTLAPTVYRLLAEAPHVNVNLMLDANNPDDTADYGDPKSSTGAAAEVTHCFRCRRLAIDHAPGKYSIYGVCPETDHADD